MIDTIDAFTTADAAIHDALTALPGVVCEIAWDDATRTYRLEHRELVVTSIIDDATGDYTGWEWIQKVNHVITASGVTDLDHATHIRAQMRDHLGGTMSDSTGITERSAVKERSISADERRRGEGLIYNGSIDSQRGKKVWELSDCYCSECVHLDLADPNRNARVVLEDGAVLEHARFTSFAKPARV